MNKDILIHNVDTELLREQTAMIYELASVELNSDVKESLEGILNLLETMLDVAEDI